MLDNVKIARNIRRRDADKFRKDNIGKVDGARYRL